MHHVHEGVFIWRLAKDIGSSGKGAIGGSEVGCCRFWRLNLSSLHKQQVLVASEPPLQPPVVYSFQQTAAMHVSFLF